MTDKAMGEALRATIPRNRLATAKKSRTSERTATLNAGGGGSYRVGFCAAVLER
jgi:hypothetical protein